MCVTPDSKTAKAIILYIQQEPADRSVHLADISAGISYVNRIFTLGVEFSSSEQNN